MTANPGTFPMDSFILLTSKAILDIISSAIDFPSIIAAFCSLAVVNVTYQTTDLKHTKKKDNKNPQNKDLQKKKKKEEIQMIKFRNQTKLSSSPEPKTDWKW